MIKITTISAAIAEKSTDLAKSKAFLEKLLELTNSNFELKEKIGLLVALNDDVKNVADVIALKEFYDNENPKSESKTQAMAAVNTAIAEKTKELAKAKAWVEEYKGLPISNPHLNEKVQNLIRLHGEVKTLADVAMVEALYEESAAELADMVVLSEVEEGGESEVRIITAAMAAVDAAIAQQSAELVKSTAFIEKFKELTMSYSDLAENVNKLMALNEEATRIPHIVLLVKLHEAEKAKALSFLEPLEKKLKIEQDPVKKEAAAEMITSIKEAVSSYMDDNCTYEDFATKVNSSTRKASSILEQDSGWKKVMNAVADAIINYFSHNDKKDAQAKTRKHFYFFANPNSVAKEMEDAESNLRNMFNPK